MFIDAVKEYSKTVLKKLDTRWLHIALLLVLHFVVTSQLQSIKWIIVWTIFWLITVPPFAGWYIACYKPKK
ncbi:hypothetical protein D3C87_980410 [compost metagenome]